MSGDEVCSLYLKYRPFIYSRCLRLLHDRAAAEDATQETFLRLHRREDALPEPAVRGWLYRVASNYCLNELRRRRTQAVPQAELPELAAPSFDERRAVDVDLAKRLVARAPRDIGETAWLYHVREHDQDQIAQAMGISRRSVVNYLVRFKAFAHRYVRNNASADVG
jgi:RNA polymerase sigma-70 factor (ECF subfamily)